MTYTYSQGLRKTMTDATGVRTFNYDFNGRLGSKGTPEGGFISYTRDLAENVTQINAPGALVNYTYDALNRLSTVQESNTGTTTYSYDNVGNLQSVTYPNGVVHTYAYDTRNRLTNLGVTGNTAAPGQPAVAGATGSYAYTLDAAGHRLSVSELSGRTVNYGYDNLYRLTSETIAADPHAINGAVNYTYDAVGNRTQITSTLAAIPAGTFNYDANDRFTVGDTYDANGNTVTSGGIANVAARPERSRGNFENHLIQQGGVTIAVACPERSRRDGDGNRVSKTIAGATTKCLVDTENPTGYAQVIAELTGPLGSVSTVYVYGLEQISQNRRFASSNPISYFVHDGHGPNEGD